MTDRDLKTTNTVDSNDEGQDDLKQTPGDLSVEGQDLVKLPLPEVTWTEDEEAKAKRKYARHHPSLPWRDSFSNNARLDMIIMPLLGLGYFCLRMSMNLSTRLLGHS